MEISLGQQFSVALFSVMTGAFLGLIYDFFRIIRCLFGIKYGKILFKKIQSSESEKKISKPMESILMGITDLMYFAAATVIMCIFIYFVNNGIVRWYIYFGAVTGFILYYFTVGRIVISFSSIIAYGIRRIFYVVFICLYEPIRPIFPFAKKYFTRVIKTLWTRRSREIEVKQRNARNVLLEYGRKS